MEEFDRTVRDVLVTIRTERRQAQADQAISLGDRLLLREAAHQQAVADQQCHFHGVTATVTRLSLRVAEHPPDRLADSRLQNGCVLGGHSTHGGLELSYRLA